MPSYRIYVKQTQETITYVVSVIDLEMDYLMNAVRLINYFCAGWDGWDERHILIVFIYAKHSGR